jgi:replicative DNA helicase
MSALRVLPADRHVPHDIDAEMAVLGSCLLDRDVIVRLQGQLEASDFYRQPHTLIWRSMLALLSRRVPIDLLTLAGEMRRAGTIDDAGGETYLTELVGNTPTAVHAEYYAGTVKECSIRRRLIAAANEIATVAWDEALPMDDVVTRADEAITTAARVRTRGGYRSVKEIASDVWERIGSGETRLIPLGLSPLDQRIGGCQPGQMVTVAARPGIGKTALAAQIANEQAKRRRPVGLITLEMTSEDVVERLVSLNSGVNMHRVRLGMTLTDEQTQQMSRGFGIVGELSIHIDDRSSGTLHDVLNRARTMHAERGIQFLIIDYVQLMGNGSKRNNNRAQELSEITRALKVLALELRIVVIALAQLNRDLEHRKPPVPMLSDLKDSGSFEQDSDIVIFIHRPDLYDDKEPPSVAELIVAKHRNGPIGTVRMEFVEHATQFVSWGGR